MAWYDGFADIAKGAFGQAKDFVSQNLGTLVGGYLDYAQLEGQAAANTLAPPAPPPGNGTLPQTLQGSGVGGFGGSGAPVDASPGSGFPMATVLLLLGSVVVVALVFKK